MTANKLSWPASLYDQAWPGATYVLSSDAAKFEQVKASTGSLTKTKAEKQEWPVDLCCPEQATVYDWVHALVETEKTILSKPFETWQVADLQLLGACLLRLSSSSGSFRTFPKERPTRVVTEEDWTMVELIEQKPWSELSDNEKKCVSEHYQTFLHSSVPMPNLIQSALESALQRIHNVLVLAKSETNQQKQCYSIIAAVEAQLGIGSIHPFEDGTRRLVRLIMATILVQNGIPVVNYCDSSKYQKQTLESVRHKNSKFLLDYTLELVKSQYPTLLT